MMKFRIRSKLCSAVILLLVAVLIPSSCVASNSDSREENALSINDELVPESLREILTEEVGNYDIPLEIQSNYVCYLSGFDDENRPIWVVEVGKWDIRKMVEGDAEMFRNFDRYIYFLIYKMLNSTQIMATEENPVDQLILLVDLDNFDLKQISSIPTVRYILDRFKLFVSAFSKVHSVFMVNTNYVAHSILELVKPIIGREFDKFEIFGNNKAKWVPRILKKIPRDQIPEWYGGTKDFRPYKVYG